jgi:hypothetical protein
MHFQLGTIGLESLTKIAGIAGSVVATLKVCAIYAVDQSLTRKIRKTTDDVDALFTRLVKLDGQEVRINALNLQQFKIQIEEDLQAKLLILAALRAQKLRRGVKRNEEPKGIQRWLLLYRPEGFIGLTIQSLYYLCILAIAMLVIAFPLILLEHDLDWLFFLPGIAVYVLLALYLKTISLRLKSTGNTVRLNAIEHQITISIGCVETHLYLGREMDGGVCAFCIMSSSPTAS